MVHITYPIPCMSYSYTYITFMVIYYIPFVMFYFHVLFSCTVIVYCFPVLYYHINFSDHFTFLYIIIYHVGSYNLMLQNLTSHSSAMFLISYHIFPHVIFKSFILCFMPVNTKKWIQEIYKGPKALYSLYETVILLGPGGAVIIVRDNDHLIKA